MANYIDQDDLLNGLSEKELAELTGDAAEAQALSAIVTWSIDSAESLIDTYLSAQVSVPLATPTPLIKNMAMNLAKYYLFLRRHRQYEAMTDEYDHIMKILDKLASGVLPVDATDSIRDTVDYGTGNRLFNTYVGT